MGYIRTAIAAAVIAFSMPSCTRYCDARPVYDRDNMVGMRVKGRDGCYEFLRDGEKVIIEKLSENGFQIERIPVGKCDFEDVSDVFEKVDEDRKPKVDLDALLSSVSKN